MKKVNRGVKKKDEMLVELREQIIRTMKSIDSEWSTVDSIITKMDQDGVLESGISLEHIGNNLRVLKDKGVVSDTKIDNRRCWSLTGNKFENTPPVRMVVAFSKELHANLSKEAARRGVPRTGVVVKAVEEHLAD